MKELSVAQLARFLSARVIAPEDAMSPGGEKVVAVGTDSRAIRGGDCFFAIKGPNFDGHDFVDQALAEGAVCAVVSRPVRQGVRLPGRCLLLVEDTVRALAELARYERRRHRYKVVAITGSVGKTSTRQMIHHVLARWMNAHQSPKSFNNEIGVPLTLLSARPEDEVVVAELGTNRPGEIGNLSRIAEPDIAVVTNVHPAHLEGFGSLDAIIEEKLSIADGLSGQAPLLIHGDIDPLVQACRRKGVAFKTFGRSRGCEYRAEAIHCEGLSSRFEIDGTRIDLPLPGSGNVDNALCAWAVCSRLGIGLDGFRQAIQTVSGVSMRLEPVQIGSLTVLDDCYNANPASMKNALQVLLACYSARATDTKRRCVFICGDMLELGRESEAFHAELGADIAAAGVHLLIAVGQYAKTTARAAEATSVFGLEAICFADVSKANEALDEFIGKDDIILVKGSRSVRLETAVRKLRELFASGHCGSVTTMVKDS